MTSQQHLYLNNDGCRQSYDIDILWPFINITGYYYICQVSYLCLRCYKTYAACNVAFGTPHPRSTEKLDKMFWLFRTSTFSSSSSCPSHPPCLPSKLGKQDDMMSQLHLLNNDSCRQPEDIILWIFIHVIKGYFGVYQLRVTNIH